MYFSISACCCNLFFFSKNSVLWLLQYATRRRFDWFILNVVDALHEGVRTKVAVIMKLIGNSWVGYKIMNRSRHKNTKNVKLSWVDKVINRSVFKSLNELTDQIFEVEMSKTGFQRKGPIIAGFFILLYAKFTMLQLQYNVFPYFCDTNIYEIIELETDSLHMALSGEKPDEISRPEMRPLW